MKTFFSYTLRQTVLINLLFVLAMAVGLFALEQLPLERYPNVHMGKVQITTILPGASPREVETLVTRKIEDALDDLEAVEFIQASSYRQRSVIMVKFVDDSDYAALYDELRIKVLDVMKDLPPDIDPPVFNEITVSEWLPAVSVNLVGDRSNRALTLMAKEIKLRLRRIKGVKDVEINGEYIREYHVLLDPHRLNKFGLTFDEVAAALRAADVSVPAGDYKNQAGEFVVVVDELFRNRDQIASVVIRRDQDGSFVTVGDVMSDAYMSYRDPFVMTSVNGKDCVTLKVIKTDDGNAMDIVPAVERVADRYREALTKENVAIVLTQDQRVYIYDAINTLGMNLAVGVVLVSLLIYWFMGFRNALLTVVGIPFSFLVTMLIMWLLHNSLNEITLFSLVLVSGIIVDDAIVVVENVYRYLEEGLPLREAIIEGASEVALPVIAATSTTVAAFLPMLIMSGSTGEFFAQIPIGITAALCASLFECLLILPSHFLDWPGGKKAEQQSRKQNGRREMAVMRVLRRGTDSLVRLTLRYRWTSLALVLLAFVSAIAILGVSITGKYPLIRIKFFPEEYTNYYIEIQGPVATPIQVTHEKLKEISRFILPGRPNSLKAATGIAGFYIDEDYRPVFGTNLGHVNVEMPRKDRMRLPDNPGNDPARHLEYMRRKLARFAVNGWSLRVRAEKGGPPTGKDVNVRVVGPDPGVVDALARDMFSFMKRSQDIAPFLIDLSDNRGQKNRVFRFHVRRKRAAEYDLTPLAVSRLAASVLDGRYLGEFRTADEDVDLKLKIDPSFLGTPEAALAIPLVQDPSGPVRLGDLVFTETYMEPNRLERYQGSRAITLTADLKAGSRVSLPTIIHRIEQYYESIRARYPGAGITFSGEFEATRRSYRSLYYAFFIAVLVIYLILATQFQSYLQPLIILSAVVFGVTGVIYGKFLTHGLFTVNSFIAVVGVTGVVVNDSLVLIDFINRSYRSGLSRSEAIMAGVRTRLRPILLTTLTTTLGLLPMALGFPSHSLVWGSMASTFVTGLCTATFLTLFIVPVEWDLLMALKLRREKGPGTEDDDE